MQGDDLIMIRMKPDGTFVTDSGCGDEVCGDGQDVLPCLDVPCDVPVLETRPSDENEMLKTMATNVRGQQFVNEQNSEGGMRLNEGE